MKKVLIIIIFSVLIGFFSSLLFLNYFENKNTPGKEFSGGVNYLENKIINISEKSSSSVVSIIEEKDLNIFELNSWSLFNNEIGGGSGFFINKDGVIITNKHVVKNKNSKYIIILNNGKKFNSKIIYFDKNKDIALLQILPTEKFNSLPLKFVEEKTKLKIGQFIIAIGNTFGELNNSVSFGIISGLNRKIENNYLELNNLIQIDANINPGNSGGPLLNLEGKVIGINTLIINGNSNIGFAIKVDKNDIDKILKEIKK